MTDTALWTRHARCGGCGQVVPVDDLRRLVVPHPRSDIYRDGTTECLGTLSVSDPVPGRFVFLADPDNPQLPSISDPDADPAIEVVTADQMGDYHDVKEAIEAGRKLMAEHVPPRYRNAVVDQADVADWVRSLVRSVDTDRRAWPRIDHGRSLLLLGPTGTGKTHAAYGAARALSVCGVHATWRFTTVADLYARLRPRPRIDSEEEFEGFTRIPILFLDDLGAAKNTEWTEEINYRLINHRYEQEKPTFITSNVPPKELGEALGERVASRLIEMCDRVVLRGTDRRRTIAKGAVA